MVASVAAAQHAKMFLPKPNGAVEAEGATIATTVMTTAPWGFEAATVRARKIVAVVATGHFLVGRGASERAAICGSVSWP